jgi:hypothetical protein
MKHQAFILLALILAAAGTQAQVLEIKYADQDGFGFRDTRSATPVPGNPGTTLGAQRRAVLEAAVDIWASRLDAGTSLRVKVSFDDLGCGEETTLGLGGTTGIVWNFPTAPLLDTNYPLSLGTALRGQRYTDFEEELQTTYNFRIDDGDCLNSIEGYWYGLDPNVPPALGSVSFLELVLHEIGHGLGFASLTDRETRDFLGSPPRRDVMSTLLFGLNENLSWDQMTSEQRRNTSTSGNGLVWTGERANQRGAERLLPPGILGVSPPVSGSDRFTAWIQGFPPFLPLEGRRGNLVLVDGPNPGSTSEPWHRNLACQPLSNAAAVAGNIALVRRGECTFAQKWQTVFNAGAVGMVLSDNQPAGSSNAIERDRGIALDRNLPVPIWFVSRLTGDALRSALPGLEVDLAYNLNAPARGTNAELINMLASTDTVDSNVSHFSNQMFPQSVMNPSVTNIAFGGDLDLVPDFFYDLGWRSDAAKLAQYSGNWYNPSRDGEGCQLTMEQGQNVPVLTCYLYRDGEPFWLLGVGEHRGDRYEFPDMIVTEGADYGSAFDPADVVRSRWGQITMRILDCNQARFEFQPDNQGLLPLTSQMQKIVPGDCNRRANQQINRSRSGNYYDPDRDGEGIQLAREANGTAWVLTWYTYLEGRQVWMLGAGTANGNRIDFDEMIITRGGQWGQAFNPAQIERINFGQIQLDFLDCNRVNVKIDPVLNDYEATEREMTRIVPGSC